MEHNLTVEAILLYQKASLVADDLRKQQNQGNRPPIPTAFAREFFAFIDRLNLRLMEDKDNFFGYFLFQMGKEIRFSIADATSVTFKGTRYISISTPSSSSPCRRSRWKRPSSTKSCTSSPCTSSVPKS